jgi:hypothetical protein
MGIKIKKFFRIVSIFVISAFLTNVNLAVTGNASEMEFRDQKQNSWIAVSANSVGGQLHFEWSSALDDVKVQISGSNQVLVDGFSNGSVDIEVPSGDAQGEYVFDATRETKSVSDDELVGQSPRFQQYMTTLKLGTLPVPTSILDQQAASASGQAAKTYLRYQTFIPDYYLGAPDGACTPDSKKYLFAGDGRNFDPNSSAFRTRFQVTVDWSTNGAISYSRTVGTTKRYQIANNGLPILSSETSATASNEGMTLTARSTSSTLTHYLLNHSVTNPMCNTIVTNPIWYDADVWIARSGAYTVTVNYNRVPNHELYLKDSDESNWTTLLQATTYSMNCLDKTDKTQLFCGSTFATDPGASR